MYNFEYSKAKSVADAAKAASADAEAKLVAGGMTLIPTLKQRLAKPTALIDLNGIAELAGIKRDGNNLVIGAMTRHAEVARSKDVQAVIPALAHLASLIGDPPYATAAPSAARSPTTTRRPTTPPACSASTPPW